MTLKRYFAERILTTVVLLISVTVLNFLLFRMMPGDPVQIVAGVGELTQEQMDVMRHMWGLDKPILEQLVIYMQNMFRGDFGLSFVTHRPVLDEIAYWLPNTVLLMIPSFVIAIALGILLGVFSASRLGKKSDHAVLSVALTTYSLPIFWTALLLLTVFSTKLGLFPLAGVMSRPPPTRFWYSILDVLWHMVLPVACLSLSFLGQFVLIVRNSMMDELTQDYMLTARAKGLPPRRVLYRYAFRNATLPLSTAVALSLGHAISGQILAETVFSWQGMGKYIYDSVLSMDFPVLQAIFFILAITVVVANFAVDIVYMFLDPRIRY